MFCTYMTESMFLKKNSYKSFSYKRTIEKPAQSIKTQCTK